MANPYTWVEPVTNRASGTERMTHGDMNRIATNLAWLYYQCFEIGIRPAGSVISKTTWIQNDIITVTEWSEIKTCLNNVCEALQYAPGETVNNRMDFQNINIVEKIELGCYEILAAYENVPNMNHYVGDRMGSLYRYAGDSMNSGGRYD